MARLESATAASRRVPAVWEVAERAGIPALVVGWWTTYPAVGPATVLSNHLYFAARAGRLLSGEGWPAEATARAARLVQRTARVEDPVERLAADAAGLDTFNIAAFRQAWEEDRPRLALVYLPGIDILLASLADPARTATERVRLARAIEDEADRVAAFVRSPLPGGEPDLKWVVLDGGRGERTGRLVASGQRTAEGGSLPKEARPVDLAPTLLSALGVPSSRGTDGRVDERLLAKGAATRATVASWGRRSGPTLPPIDPKEYVENLRSLGYLK
jgi:hypothetical protein